MYHFSYPPFFLILFYELLIVDLLKIIIFKYSNLIISMIFIQIKREVQERDYYGKRKT
jgi:hypothetical protein